MSKSDKIGRVGTSTGPFPPKRGRAEGAVLAPRLLFLSEKKLSLASGASHAVSVQRNHEPSNLRSRTFDYRTVSSDSSAC
jgi:hypothetical protein